MARADVHRRAAPEGVEADRARVQVAVARIAQVAQAALQGGERAGLLFFHDETHVTGFRLAGSDEVDAGLVAALADTNDDCVALHVDVPAIHARRHFGAAFHEGIELRL